MPKDPRLLLQHILTNIERIEDTIRDLTEEDFQHDQTIQDATIRRLEIIGEAVSHLPSAITDQQPHIPWQDIISMRNLLIHEYFNVDTSLVWETTQQNLPDLKQAIEKLISSL